MSEVAETKLEPEVGVRMQKMCAGLFQEWLVDLTSEEKETWLWNALAEMLKIKQRRKI